MFNYVNTFATPNGVQTNAHHIDAAPTLPYKKTKLRHG